MPPALTISSAASASAAGSRAAITNCTRSRANRKAIARPIPRLPPVTTAIFPARFLLVSIFSILVRPRQREERFFGRSGKVSGVPRAPVRRQNDMATLWGRHARYAEPMATLLPYAARGFHHQPQLGPLVVFGK